MNTHTFSGALWSFPFINFIGQPGARMLGASSAKITIKSLWKSNDFIVLLRLPLSAFVDFIIEKRRSISICEKHINYQASKMQAQRKSGNFKNIKGIHFYSFPFYFSNLEARIPLTWRHSISFDNIWFHTLLIIRVKPAKKFLSHTSSFIVKLSRPNYLLCAISKITHFLSKYSKLYYGFSIPNFVGSIPT